eukprot:CAMPEP_0181338866 /NCGR_PEP_ID=MMETSP1101-20121128/28894_1 /TAXON_ID=46948 /ORGANISM="Rhodomonas abbreviata, Strain Caron Lab Isolate" /LENGTH=86 /DNA_ID=CAMNT_0023449683 /DNA_START=1 /DNA_END=261 /DNA_ORIENTATION=-
MKRVIWNKAALTGPRILSLSTKDSHLITFTDPSSAPYMNWEGEKAPDPPAKMMCAVTGQPAKYRDPLTGQPFATLAAFKQLREKAS